eukprot:1048196-Pelagomonas_calceolata.AAC.8
MRHQPRTWCPEKGASLGGQQVMRDDGATRGALCATCMRVGGKRGVAWWLSSSTLRSAKSIHDTAWITLEGG